MNKPPQVITIEAQFTSPTLRALISCGSASKLLKL